ncbi:MAG TPA: PGPGW domain-containing protein [Labilithrix sp.]|nr:PGPGW domain-containing protein [Labilithrix sp.]
MSRTVELIIGIVSITMFVGTLAAIPWLVRRLPADYFVRPPPKHSLAKTIARNVLGFVLIAAGIAMLLLPGQGIITILIGLSIVDLPIKHRAIRWLLQRPKIQEGVQRLRSKAGKPPLVIPAPA